MIATPARKKMRLDVGICMESIAFRRRTGGRRGPVATTLRSSAMAIVPPGRKNTAPVEATGNSGDERRSVGVVSGIGAKLTRMPPW